MYKYIRSSNKAIKYLLIWNGESVARTPSGFGTHKINWNSRAAPQIKIFKWDARARKLKIVVYRPQMKPITPHIHIEPKRWVNISMGYCIEIANEKMFHLMDMMIVRRFIARMVKDFHFKKSVTNIGFSQKNKNSVLCTNNAVTLT